MAASFIDDTLQRLAALGVREVCVAAGARNVSLLRALTLSRHVRLWNFFEERSMAFFALGRIMATGRPVAVVTTSGTAAVETMPAVVEACHQGRPLIVVSADRPRHYRGSGAPQAINQTRLFGPHADFIDVAEDSTHGEWPTRLTCRPLQVNVCLEEGLADVSGIDFVVPDPASDHSPPPTVLHAIDLVLAAGLSNAEAAQLAPVLLALGAPIVAEATANLSASLDPLLLRGGERALAALAPQRVLRIGSVPSWRWWRDLEDRPQIEVVHLSQAPYPGLARDIGKPVFPMNTPLQGSSGTSSAPGLGSALDSTLQAHPLCEPSWMRHLAAAIPAGSSVFLGNSLPIREWNLAGHGRPGTTFHASRGTNGIDGLVSTFLGLGADVPESWIILGDLSALYDLAAPWMLDQLPAANRRIVIINNGGGRIFSRVKRLQTLDDTTRSLIENRHTHRFEAWASMWHCAYRLVTQPGDLAALPGGPVVLEILPDAGQTDAFWRDWSGG